MPDGTGACSGLCVLIANLDDGKAKLYLTWKILRLRKIESRIFQRGRYVPLQATGQRSEHVCAFAREYAGRVAVAVVPRLCATLLDENFITLCDEKLWGDTPFEVRLPPSSCYHSVLTGECFPTQGEGGWFLPLGKLLQPFPVALLLNELSTCRAACHADPRLSG